VSEGEKGKGSDPAPATSPRLDKTLFAQVIFAPESS